MHNLEPLKIFFFFFKFCQLPFHDTRTRIRGWKNIGAKAHLWVRHSITFSEHRQHEIDGDNAASLASILALTCACAVRKKEVSRCRPLGNAILYFLRCWKGFVYPMPFSQIYAQHKAILLQELTLFQEKMSSSFRLSKSHPQSKNRLSVVSARRKLAICYKMFLVMVFSCPPCVLGEYFSSDYSKLVRVFFAYVL